MELSIKPEIFTIIYIIFNNFIIIFKQCQKQKKNTIEKYCT